MKKQDERFVIICLLLFAFFASQIECANQINVSPQEQKERDLIEKLPGQPPVSFKQYGGYVTVDEATGRALYYYFVETTSTNASAPLVLWLNGGPDCSSVGNGGMQGHGPFRVNDDSKTLYTNPYSWNKIANVLIIDSPAEAGFSFANSSTITKVDDKKTANENYAFLVNWFERFPEYKDREFYLAGESYAGHFIPQLAQLIYRKNNNKSSINLQGLFIGNPAMNFQLEQDDQLNSFARFALVSADYIQKFKDLCTPLEKQKQNEVECGVMIMKIGDDRRPVYDSYIYARWCPKNKVVTNCPPSVLNADPCSKYYVDDYLNIKEVQEALHVKSNITWQDCNMDANEKYERTFSMINVYKELIDAAKLRMWVYSGDLDISVSSKVTKAMLRSTNATVVETWRPWYDGVEVGGYVESYKGKALFATVKGAGHEVPFYKPKSLFALFTSFVSHAPPPHKSTN